MRAITSLLLSEYGLGHATVESVRQFVEDVDWDARDLPADERSVLLGIEARLAGIDEGLTDEGELRTFITQSTQLDWDLPSNQTLVHLMSGANNELQRAQLWAEVV